MPSIPHIRRAAPLWFALLTIALAATGRAGQINADVCIVGGGSGGIGAAIAAARAGADVVLVERDAKLGGTSVNAYVSVWQPGPGGSIARDIYDRLHKRGAVCITRDYNLRRKLGPFGLWLADPGGTYEQTLRRSGRTRDQWRAVSFDPAVFSEVVAQMLAETAHARVMLRTTFVEATSDGSRVEAIRAVAHDGAVHHIRAKVFIDCTGSAVLCRSVGCETMLGSEPKSRFQEPAAPRRQELMLNAISLCYRVRKAKVPRRQPPPSPAPKSFPRSAHVQELPCGDLIINPLATIPGEALLHMTRDEAMVECRRRVQAQWRWLQQREPFSRYEFHSFASRLGVREGRRAFGEYVLTQQDVTAGLAKQKHRDIIALADHSLDVHGAGHRRIRGSVPAPYGVPYRCLIPKGWRNLLIASRGASFSQIAASSCRLSRTIMALGHAAGLAAAMAAEQGVDTRDVDVRALRKRLGLAQPE